VHDAAIAPVNQKVEAPKPVEEHHQEPVHVSTPVNIVK
jgi:hypothetical protein